MLIISVGYDTNILKLSFKVKFDYNNFIELYINKNHSIRKNKNV